MSNAGLSCIWTCGWSLFIRFSYPKVPSSQIVNKLGPNGTLGPAYIYSLGTWTRGLVAYLEVRSSWGIVSTYSWSCNPTYDQGNLLKFSYGGYT